MEKRKTAVAIKYDKKDVAPTVLAKGKGVVAENIIQHADEESITIVKDEVLVEELLKVDIGEYIPEELYEVVASVLLYITNLDEARDRFI